MTLPWYLLPIEILQLIFKHFSTIDSFKYHVISSLYSSDYLIQETLYNIWSTRSDWELFNVSCRLKNKKLFLLCNPSEFLLNIELCHTVRNAIDNTTDHQQRNNIIYQKDARQETRQDIKNRREDCIIWIELLISLGANDWNGAMCCAAENGDLVMIEYFIARGANYWNYGMESAILGDHLEIIEYFIAKGANKWIDSMMCAARNGNLYLVEFFANKDQYSLVEWNNGMNYAIIGGHLQIIEYFIQRGANNWYDSMNTAAEYGHLWLVEYFIAKIITNTAVDYNKGMESAARGGQLNIVKYFVDKGANTWNSTMAEAIDAGDIDIIDYLISKGASLDFGMTWAIENGDLRLVKYFTSKGYTNWKEALNIDTDNLELVKYIESIIALES